MPQRKKIKLGKTSNLPSIKKLHIGEPTKTKSSWVLSQRKKLRLWEMIVCNLDRSPCLLVELFKFNDHIARFDEVAVVVGAMFQAGFIVQLPDDTLALAGSKRDLQRWGKN